MDPLLELWKGTRARPAVHLGEGASLKVTKGLLKPPAEYLPGPPPQLRRLHLEKGDLRRPPAAPSFLASPEVFLCIRTSPS